MRVLLFLYGIFCYVVFLCTTIYAVGFIGNFGLARSLDIGGDTSFGKALLINVLLLFVFAVQHSVMARKSFKEKWTQLIPAPIERSTYVLFSSLALLLIFWQWQPMGGVIWDVSGTLFGAVLLGISLMGWLFVLISSFLLDHFELFGLKQVFVNLTGKAIQSSDFRTPAFYKLVRHPIYLGFTVAFWATPIMTVAHLVFAVGMLVYTLGGIFFEEKDLVALFGDEYKRYKKKVPMLIPLAVKKDIN